MAQVLIRAVDDDVVANLKRKAKARGTLLQEVAREALAAAARPTREELLAEIDSIREGIGPSPGFDSTAELRKLRDGDDDPYH